MYIKYLWISSICHILIYSIFIQNEIIFDYRNIFHDYSRWKVRRPIVVLRLGFGVPEQNRSVAEKSRSSRTKMARFTMDNAGKIFKPLIVPDNHCVCRKSATLFTISFKHEIVLSKNACPWWCMPDSTVKIEGYQESPSVYANLNCHATTRWVCRIPVIGQRYL